MRLASTEPQTPLSPACSPASFSATASPRRTSHRQTPPPRQAAMRQAPTLSPPSSPTRSPASATTTQPSHPESSRSRQLPTASLSRQSPPRPTAQPRSRSPLPPPPARRSRSFWSAALPASAGTSSHSPAPAPSPSPPNRMPRAHTPPLSHPRASSSHPLPLSSPFRTPLVWPIPRIPPSPAQSPASSMEMSPPLFLLLTPPTPSYALLP